MHTLRGEGGFHRDEFYVSDAIRKAYMFES